jgi:hypothetical protein
MVAGGAVSAEEMDTSPDYRPVLEYEESISKKPIKSFTSLDELEYILQEYVPNFDELLTITESPESFKVNRAKYLETDLWQQINDKIQEFGGKWVSDGKDSHWIVPKKQ